jgi:hypothetical protein
VTREEVCAALECVHLDIPWDPELVRVWALACVGGRQPNELGRYMGVDETTATAAWRRLAELASQRLRQLAPAPTGATWEVLVYREDEIAQEPRVFSTRCEAIEAAFEGGWNSGGLRAVLVERDAAGALRSARELSFG